MKNRMIRLSTICLSILCIVSFVSCEHNEEPKSLGYKVEMSSKSLYISSTFVNYGKDLITNIGVKNSFDRESLLHLPEKLAFVYVFSGSSKKELEKNDYIYSPTNGSFKINKEKITGNIQIIAEAEKEIKKVGDFGTKYVSDNSFSYTLELEKDHAYFANANSSREYQLDIYIEGKEQIREKLTKPYWCEVSGDYTFTIASFTTDTINDTVQTIIYEVLSYNAPQRIFTLDKKSHNERFVAFAFDPYNNNAYPVIYKGNNYLGNKNIYNYVSSVITAPTLFDFSGRSAVAHKLTNQWFNGLYMPEEDFLIINHCEGFNYMILAYLDNIKQSATIEDDNQLEITSNFEKSCFDNNNGINIPAGESISVCWRDLLPNSTYRVICNTMLDIKIYDYYTFNIIDYKNGCFTTKNNCTSIVLIFNGADSIPCDYIKCVIAFDRAVSFSDNVIKLNSRNSNKNYNYSSYTGLETKIPFASFDVEKHKNYAVVFKETTSLINDAKSSISFLDKSESISSKVFSSFLPLAIDDSGARYYTSCNVIKNIDESESIIPLSSLVDGKIVVDNIYISCANIVKDGEILFVNKDYALSTYNVRMADATSSYDIFKGKQGFINTFAVEGYDYYAIIKNKTNINNTLYPEDLIVKCGDNTLIKNTDYTYSKDSGEIKINHGAIVGDITIKENEI